MEQRFKEVHEKIDRMSEKQENTNTRTFNSIVNIDNNHKKLENRYDEFMKQYNDLAKEDLKTLLTSKSENHFDAPRGFSINQFKSFFTDLQLKSNLKSDFDRLVDRVDIHSDDIANLEGSLKITNNQILEHVKERDRKIDEEHNFIDQVKKDNENKHHKVTGLIKVNSDRIKELKQISEDTKIFEEGALNQMDKLGTRIENLKGYVNVELRDLNIKISQDMDDLVTDYKKLNDQTYTEVSENNDKNTKKIREIDNKIRVQWKKAIEDFEKTIEKFKLELTEKLDQLNQASKNRTNKIKDICTNYFSEHENNVSEIQSKVSGVTQAFDDWKMYVMNPQSINEARIHSLDVK